MELLLITSFMGIAQYYFAGTLKFEHLSGRLVCVGVLVSAQIIVTELILGIFGFLYAPLLILVNSLLSLGLIVYSAKQKSLRDLFIEDIKIIQERKKAIWAWENVALMVLGLFVTVWFFFAAYFLPPRGVDDLGYHLPVIYEYILQHKIVLLPIELRFHFAFPFNAELLFLWPAMILHSQQWVDIVQFFMAVLGVGVVYSFARMMDLKSREAFFVALLFFFTPIVLNQIGSNYIDLTYNVFFLTSLYFVLRSCLTKNLTYLYIAAISTGLLLGMKYGAIPLVIILQFFVFPMLARQYRKQLVWYVMIIVALGSFWYVRNWIVLGDPLYPTFLDTLGGSAGNFSAHGPISIGKNMHSFFTKVKVLYSHDVGLGSFAGGFGMVFWGMAFPGWVCIWVNSFKNFTQEGFLRWIFWTQMIFGLAVVVLAPVPMEEFKYISRYSLFVVAIGLIALGKVLELLQFHKIFLKTIKILCIYGAALSVILLSDSAWPVYRLNTAILDRRDGENPSEFRYYRDGVWFLPPMSYSAELLDLLTRGDAKGLSCYMASDYAAFWTTHIYGSKLQNRVWNFEKNPSRDPDAYIYQTLESDQVVYIGRKITLGEIALNPAYQLIAATPYSSFFIRNEFFENKDKIALLLKYYEETFPFNIEVAAKVKEHLEPDIPFVLDNSVGHGFQYFKFKGDLQNKVYWVPPDYVGSVIEREKLRVFYTFGYSFPGFSSHKIYDAMLDGQVIVIYKNQK